MQDNRQQILEEWLNLGFWKGDSINEDLIPEEVMIEMSKFWFNKIDIAVAERDRENIKILTEKKEWYSGKGNQPILKVIDEIINLITKKQ